ncbi:MAG: PASTA domain-containing protein, partial [Actinobacteria bacterium]|nr:PASTA domain-containing protein [Actinomycetota bacterium]
YKGEQPMQIAFQHATDSVPRPSVKNPGVPEQLDELVLWATERTPDDRPSDASEMLTRLREIERDLGIAPQVARTLSASTRTVDDRDDSIELTAVLPAMMTAPTATVGDTDNASLLRRSTKRRATKGAWLIVLVVLLAALAGGTGWWFGSGPGSMVPVPDVSGRTFDDAKALLAAQSLQAVQQDQYNLDVVAGTTLGSEPASGTRVDKDSIVTVVVSQGPQPHDVGALAGMSADQARAALIAANLVVGENSTSFTDAEANTVIGASVTPRSTGTAIDCSKGCTVHEGDAATLSVSLGPVPSVAGKSVADATSILMGKSLQVSGTSTEKFSDSVAAGIVLDIAGRPGGGNWKPGDTVTLIVSKGPQLFPVPDVSGKNRDDAVKTLESAGFKVNYAPFFAQPFPNALTKVTGTDPAAGTQKTKGSTIYLRISAFG